MGVLDTSQNNNISGLQEQKVNYNPVVNTPENLNSSDMDNLVSSVGGTPVQTNNPTDNTPLTVQPSNLVKEYKWPIIIGAGLLIFILVSKGGK